MPATPYLVSRVLSIEVHGLVRPCQLPPGISGVHHAASQRMLRDLGSKF